MLRRRSSSSGRRRRGAPVPPVAPVGIMVACGLLLAAPEEAAAGQLAHWHRRQRDQLRQQHARFLLLRMHLWLLLRLRLHVRLLLWLLLQWRLRL